MDFSGYITERKELEWDMVIDDRAEFNKGDGMEEELKELAERLKNPSTKSWLDVAREVKRIELKAKMQETMAWKGLLKDRWPEHYQFRLNTLQEQLEQLKDGK